MPPDPRFFPPAGSFDLEQLAEISGAKAQRKGSVDAVYTDVAALDDAGETSVSFLDNKIYLDQFRETRAGCCIVSPVYADQAPAAVNLLLSDTPYLAYAKIAEAFHPDADRSYCPDNADNAIHPSATIGEGTILGSGVVVGPHAEIGRNCRIGPNSFIGDGVQIADNCKLGPSVSVRFAIIGSNVTLFAGVRIGEAGFGFAASPTGAVTVPQVGRVVIEDYVEIGANSTIDRGAGPDTVVGAGTRIDNLVQIGHNVTIGKGCIIVAQTGVAGSCTIGNGVQIGGQVGIAGHLRIGDGARIAAQSGIMRDIAAGATVAGSPSLPAKQYFRQVAALSRLAGAKDS
jgi:UDP-3-O-[3-hydroxymyristoyl] glucosamine N-acyltransferase